MSTVEGEYDEEFWIRCQIPIRVKITCTVISPNLLVYHPNKTKDFVAIDFSSTYFGVCSERRVVIKNHSISNAMHCTMAEIKREEHV